MSRILRALGRIKWYWWVVGVSALLVAWLASLRAQGYVWADWTKFEGKGVWDVMELVIIPVTLAVMAFLLDRVERKTDREIAEKRAETDREIALSNQQETALQNYFDFMTDLILKADLRKSSFDDDIREIARVKTITVLQGLDKDRKRKLIEFLSEVHLVTRWDVSKGWNMVTFQYENRSLPPVISLHEIDLAGVELKRINLAGAKMEKANLSKANLAFADLEMIDLFEADLTEIDLYKADLEKGDLSGANLIRANLSNAYLMEANLKLAKMAGARLRMGYLREADLEKADLAGADMTEVNLSGANLTGANLKGANLKWAKLIGANLTGANLEGAYMYYTDIRDAVLDETIMSNGKRFNPSDGSNNTNDNMGERIEDED